MKKYLLAAVVLGGVFMSGCWRDKIPTRQQSQNLFTVNDTITLGWQKKDCDTMNSICLTLDSVISDSRCPLRVQCPWVGNAEVRFIFNDGSTNHVIFLNTLGETRFPRDTTIGKYTIEMLELRPYPSYPGSIDQKDYFARVVVRK